MTYYRAHELALALALALSIVLPSTPYCLATVLPKNQLVPKLARRSFEWRLDPGFVAYGGSGKPTTTRKAGHVN